MSNSLSAQYVEDESEDEEDFNPVQADDSGNEDNGGLDHDDDAGAQIQNEASRRRVSDEGSDDEVAPKSRRAPQDDEDDEDAEGEGEDTAPGAHDDDDEEDEDEEEEEITVSTLSPVPKILRELRQPVGLWIDLYLGTSQKA